VLTVTWFAYSRSNGGGRDVEGSHMATSSAVRTGDMVSRYAGGMLRASLAAAGTSVRLVDSIPREVVDDIFACALKKQARLSFHRRTWDLFCFCDT
jgi:hypothetical protein